MSKLKCVVDRVLDHYLTGPEKWVKGVSVQEKVGPDNTVIGHAYCAIGAIRAAARECYGFEANDILTYTENMPVSSAVEKVARMLLAEVRPLEAEYFISVPGWNDDSSRTFPQVRAAFEAVKAKLDAAPPESETEPEQAQEPAPSA